MDWGKAKSETMKIELKKALIHEKEVVSRLLQLYLYEFSELDGFDVGPDGLFRYEYLDSYWRDPASQAVLIYVEDCIAGFALVNSYTCLLESRDARSIAEFFVLRKYRMKGVGKTAAFELFNQFPGKWEVRQIPKNEGGQQFWRKVIGAYTGGKYEETVLNNELWEGPVQTFSNGSPQA
jgi:predicted acetyltransferase